MPSVDLDFDRRAAGPVDSQVNLVITGLDRHDLCLPPAYPGDLFSVDEDVVGPPAVCPSSTLPDNLQLR